jgi:hypothetical protein
MSKLGKPCDIAHCSPALLGYARAMSGSAHALLACLSVLVLVALAPAPAARAAPPLAYPGAQPLGPPPGRPLAPPGATAPAPRVPDWGDWQVYDAASKSEGLAVVMELFFPGLGSVYAEHWAGAATTWGVSLGGILVMFWGLGQTSSGDNDAAAGLGFTAGILMMVGGRVYGLVDSYRATSRYNRDLARRLGLYGNMVIGPIPLQVNGQTSLGLGAAWQF